MASTASSSSSDPTATATAAAASQAQSHKQPPLLRPNPHPNPSHPPLFLAKPINAGPAAASSFFPSAGPARAYPPRPAADRVVTVANPAGYIRNSSPTAVMSLQPQVQPRPFAFAAAGAASDPAVGPHPMRPPQRQQHHQFVVPRQQVGASGAHRVAPAPGSAQPKVAALPSASSAPGNNSNDREQSREDIIVVIHDRKVRLSDGSSDSLYALCRSWVRNGLPQESQPKIGDSLRILPKPLPASVVNPDPHIQKLNEDATEEENFDKEEDLSSGEQLSAQDLLKGHIKRAKKIRARVKQERLLRIERYKQRLSLLLPTQMELIARNEATPGPAS